MKRVGQGQGRCGLGGKAFPLGGGRGSLPGSFITPTGSTSTLCAPPTFPHPVRSQPQGLSILLSPTRIKMDQETWQV